MSARPGRVKTKTRNLKRRASARPVLGRSRRRRKPAALAALKAENKRFRDALNWYSLQAIDDDNRAWNALHPDLAK